MSKSTDLAARAARLSGKPADKDAGEDRAAFPPRTRDVRMTVDLSPALYQKISAYPLEVGLPQMTGRARVPVVEVFRALVEELAENEDLRRAVANRVRRNGAK